ncbi:efflux RND transporter permease subunit [Chitinimonas sp. PSY-7]|uniref:efflux RND transporter permease subunit n=1 Tax=Chitinimonas sp. PSY-7 TaxID=3459088 RepID=UPI0040400563
MNFSAWAIRKPVPALLLFVVLTVMGLICLQKLGVQNFPDIELPSVTVSASLEGAAPAQLETEVARKIEDQLASLGGVEHINTTITDGSVNTTVQFELEKNSEEALNKVRNAVDAIKSELPAEMATPTVSKINTTGEPILTYTVQSDRMDEEALSWFIDNEVNKAMLAATGVGKLSRLGGVNREVLIELDQAKLSGLGINAVTVANQLKAVQKDASGGEGRLGGQTQSLRTLGAVGSVAEIAALPVPLGDGRHVRLDQLASVKDTHAERTTFAMLDGKPVLSFQIMRIKGASEVEVAKAVRETITQLKQRYPLVHIAEAYNTVQPIEDNYEGSMHLLLEGAVLAILVVFWFLKDWRATVVSAIALPLSIIPTFAAMYFLDFSLNVLTLLSLALVIGILVDDAIVEVENIVRHLNMGKTPLQAAREAADEIGLAVIATTLTLVAVFLPTAFMGGIPGKFFRQFGITAAVAVLASLLVARLLTPMMAAYLLKPSEKHEQKSKLMVRYLGWVEWCLSHRKTTTAAAMGFFVGSLCLIPLLPTGFVPANDDSRTQVSIELAPGSRLAETREVAEQARLLLAKVTDVKQVFTLVGSASPTGSPMDSGNNSDVRTTTLTLKLTPRSERSYKQSAIDNEIRAALKPLAGARVSVGTNDSSEKLQIALVGDDATALETASKAVERELRGLKGIGAVTSGASLQRPELQIKPDYARAADLGVTSTQLADAVRMATYGDFSASLSKLNLPQRQVNLRVRLADSAKQDLDAIGQLRVAGAKGEVTLSSVADIKLGSGPSQINRQDRLRQITINVELNGRNMGEVMKEADALPSLRSLPANVKQQVSGDAEHMAELFNSFGLAMLIGVMCIYVVLVLLFHDFLQPATILAALPLSVGGAFLALLLTGNSFSMPSIIGLLMLMGVVSKNSILLVEYAVMARREHGMDRWNALLDACHKRARPILMTTIAMAAGMLPIAMGLGIDPSFRSPMAIAVIGGLLTSTLLSLLVIPVVFTYVDDFLVWLSKRFKLHSTAVAKPVEEIN